MTDQILPFPPRRKAVVLCVDAGYLPYALFLASQLHDKEPQRDYDICILSDDKLTIPPGFEHLRLVVPEPIDDSRYGDLVVTHLARATYLRLWAPVMLAGTYDRILYLDSDMFADAGGFSKLMDIDMRGKPLAAVLDVQQWYRPQRNVAEFKMAGRPLRRYFNGGVLLIDNATYAAQNVLDRALELAAAHPEWIMHHDQSLLNLVLDGDWVELSPIWNWQWAWKYPLFTDWVGPRLLHFIGQTKPWSDTMGYCPQRYRIAFQEFFETRLPHLPAPITPPSRVLHDNKRLLWLGLRFLTMRRKLLRYIDQFPDPYSTNDPQTRVATNVIRSAVGSFRSDASRYRD